MRKVIKMLSMVLVSAGLLGFAAGCDDDDGGGGGGGGGSVVGTWALNAGSTVTGNVVWYVHFNKDGTYTISDNADGSAERVHGTYTQSGDAVTGPFVNPGVGDGRIDATVSDGVIVLDFVEYWHSPNKHVPYAGTKF